ncbi:MAG: KUP/HAK/KT family potassium transporter [Opitutales bacterium]|jgi:KUP system potassium uptake protein
MFKHSSPPAQDSSTTRAPSTNVLALAALGVVFGDIGTSPLYTYQTAMSIVADDPAKLHTATLGVLSLLFWALTLVVTVKYLCFVTRADNRGEGGVFALLALVRKHLPPQRNLTPICLLLLFGAGLMMGDGVITPAISVLSAIQGVTVVNAGFTAWVVPVTCLILALLFIIQRYGTGALSAAFAPVMVAWFVTIGGLGAWQIVAGHFAVLSALNPWRAMEFLHEQQSVAVLVLGAVVLCVTGAEALYADLGHFGRTAIARAWYRLAWPALVLNYFGQGALVLAHPADSANPFFLMVPSGWATYLLVALSTAATIIASQALITGVFSLVRQAMQLDYFPALRVVHTSDRMEGHIYLPFVNYFLAVFCIGTVLSFRTSNELANAYGLAVTGTMLMTSLAYAGVRHQHLHRPWWDVLAVLALFLVVDIPFFLANCSKFEKGGWYPIALGTIAFIVMVTWRAGRNALRRHIERERISLDGFLSQVPSMNLDRHRGTCVYVTHYDDYMPIPLMHFAQYNRCLPGRVVLLVPEPESVPHTDPVLEAPRLETLDHGFFRLRAAYGYRDQPDLQALVDKFASQFGPEYHGESVLFYLVVPRLILGPILYRKPGAWRAPLPFQRLFQYLLHNACTEFDVCRLPDERAVEVIRRFSI